ncbi:MAG: DUF3108 domain-containing protein [Candidatus Poribacteria bacterium]|nr:DUF3108 domain-containing protein [Candidatus Poribacteria bacterium]
MRTIKILLFSCLIFVAFSLSVLTTHSLLETANLERHPIQVGEILTYTIKIAGLPAGKQVTKVVEETVLNGQPVYHLTSERQTGNMFGKLYHFRDWIESYVTTDQLYPLRYVKDLEDRKYRSHIEVDFDHDKGIAQYVKNRRNQAIEVPIGIQDELSMIYFLRSKQLSVGQTYRFPVLVKGKPQRVSLSIYRREVLKTVALGRVETLALRTSHGYLMWLTNDDRRIPVRIEAEIPIGKLVGTLEKVDFIN